MPNLKFMPTNWKRSWDLAYELHTTFDIFPAPYVLSCNCREKFVCIFFRRGGENVKANAVMQVNVNVNGRGGEEKNLPLTDYDNSWKVSRRRHFPSSKCKFESFCKR